MRKNLILLLLFVLIMVFLQNSFKEQNIVMTLHSADERELIYKLTDEYEILPGNYNPIIKMTNKAIYPVQISKNEKLYVVFARDKNTKTDSILLFEPKTYKLRGGISLSPERISTSLNDDKGVEDLNNDGNLEVFVPVVNVTRKRVRIYKIGKESLMEIKLNIPTDYSGISVKDLDFKGDYEIILSRQMNSVPLLPHVLKWNGKEFSLTNTKNYPRLVEDNIKELTAIQERAIKINSQLLALDASLSKVYTYLKIGDGIKFGEEIDKINLFADSTDPSIKLRIYRGKIYFAYVFLEMGKAYDAYDYLKEAVLYMYPENDENFVESMIYTELAIYLIDNYDFKKAKESLDKAIELNNNNEIAKNYLLALYEIN